jgi:hypothetical protein
MTQEEIEPTAQEEITPTALSFDKNKDDKNEEDNNSIATNTSTMTNNTAGSRTKKTKSKQKKTPAAAQKKSAKGSLTKLFKTMNDSASNKLERAQKADRELNATKIAQNENSNLVSLGYTKTLRNRISQTHEEATDQQNKQMDHNNNNTQSSETTGEGLVDL